MSRVLSGRTDVPISEEARQKVLDAVKKLGYQPNQSARALMTGRTGLIGFWMCLQYSRYRSQVLDKMRIRLGQTEMAMAITDVDEEYHWDRSFSRALRVPVDGIIAFDASDSIEAFAQNYDRLAPNTPFVSMGAYWSEAKSFVGIDLKAGTADAMDHLIGIGRRDVAFMAPMTSGLLTKGPRFEGYRDKMVDAGFEPRTIGSPDDTLVMVRETLQEQLDAGTMPEAILCMNDDLALAVAFALQQLGVKIGSDVAIVGFDGIEEAEFGPFPITTVKQPMEEMCSLTYQFLKAQMEDRTAPLQQKILKPQLVIRDSSRS